MPLKTYSVYTRCELCGVYDSDPYWCDLCGRPKDGTRGQRPDEAAGSNGASQKPARNGSSALQPSLFDPPARKPKPAPRKKARAAVKRAAPKKRAPKRKPAKRKSVKHKR